MFPRIRSALAAAGGFFDGILGVLYPEPPPCALCSGLVRVSASIPVCDRCLDRLPRVGRTHCPKCGRPVGEAKELCEQCRIHPPAVDYARSFGVYQGYLRECIHALKYRGELRVAEGLGELMSWTAWWDGGFGPIDRIVPVPLHPAKLRERGFNQASLLAQVVGEAMGVRVVEPVVRVRETVAQSGLSWSQRRKNVERSFEVPLPADVRGLRVLVVDDVYTTGSTVSAVSAALKRAGARTCAALCAAVAVLDRDLATLRPGGKESSGGT